MNRDKFTLLEWLGESFKLALIIFTTWAIYALPAPAQTASVLEAQLCAMESVDRTIEHIETAPEFSHVTLGRAEIREILTPMTGPVVQVFVTTAEAKDEVQPDLMARLFAQSIVAVRDTVPFYADELEACFAQLLADLGMS